MMSADDHNAAMERAVALVSTADGRTQIPCDSMNAAEAQFDRLMQSGVSVNLIMRSKSGKPFGPHCCVLKSFYTGRLS